MVYTHRAVGEDLAPRRLAAVAGLAIAVALSIWSRSHGAADQKFYALPGVQPQVISGADWQREGWRRLPLQRREMAGDQEEPFNLQLACRRSDAERLLNQAGWDQPPGWTGQSLLLALASQAGLGERPVLPRFDQGRRAALTFVAAGAAEPAPRQVLRLWLSDVEVRDATGRTRVPVWYGTVYLDQRGRSALPALDASEAAIAPVAQQLVAKGARQLAPGADGHGAPPLLLSCTAVFADPVRAKAN